MGLCFSKKKQPPSGGPGTATSKKLNKVAAAVPADDKAKKKAVQQPRSAADKNAVRAKAAAAVVTPAGEEEKKKKRAPQEDAAKQLPVVLLPSAPVRTSSCTKEEVDAILIQCGRLSRSSSGTTGRSGDTGGAEGGHHRRRRSGSKRSYDFDQERKAAAAAGGDEECDWERPVSRPSPHRGSPQRKRSGSRERSSGGGSRRASRSPGRRAEGGVSSAAVASSGAARQQQQQQPVKMVSVPATAREKGIRCASPRSSSPARMAAVRNENACVAPMAGSTPALSRSSSRKAEQSPYRRNPMAELDENTLLRNSTSNARPHQKKSTENTVAAAHQKATERGKESTVAASEARAVSAKTNGARAGAPAENSLGHQRPAGGCRSRRASRDFDQSSTNSYASHILEDIQNYHEQHQAASPPSFSLPACVAKACSILEAVADLNSSSSSSSSENCTYELEPGRSADDKGSVNALSGSGTDNRVTEPSTRRQVPATVRDIRAEAAEPQESAGSNSVSGVPWTPSWEPTSAESTDRTWSTTGDEVVDQAGSGSHGAPGQMNRPNQSKQRLSSRAGSGSGSKSLQLHRGRSAHRGSGSVASGRSGVRTVSAAS